DPERRALAEPARDLDLAAVRLGDVLDDREAEPGPPLLAGAPLVDPIEALEDARQGLLRDPDAGVLDLDARGPLPAGHPHPHRAAGAVVLDSVREHVDEHALEA